ncbi:prolyl oligopeptidase family serine peptidase [Gammaproteobacteria bacterium AB-CW1]|uniref:prolyl oligopeptidase n=1 Tax=Natronospira elongata TaxID=3110268 RepID=A0AAP6JDX0_9GAMM|nr:prolyl oligopeptidase family serine peptidase [Gammaproteobacteria bacterium AB-CW1]
MYRQSLISLSVASALALAACEAPDQETQEESRADVAETQRPAYPETRRQDLVEEIHGHEIADPYRWLEELGSEEVRDWINAQNELTFEHLESLDGRQRFKERMTELWDFERYSVPSEEAGRYFYRRNDGLQDHDVLYWLSELDDEPQVLIDPNRFSEDGTVSLTMTSVREDGEYIAYGKAEGGSDWQTFHIRNIESGEDTGDFLEWIKYSPAAWTHDHEGFFYSRYPEPEGDPLTAPNEDHRVFYHRMGQDQEDNVLVYERPDRPDWRFAPEVSDDGRYLILTVREGTDRRNRVYYLDLQDPEDPSFDGDVVELLDDFDGGYHFLDNDGETFFFYTTADAPRGRIIAIDTGEPDRDNWETIVEERERVIRGVNAVGDYFIVNYMEDAHSRLSIFGRDGEDRGDVELPTLGTVGSVSSGRDGEMFFSFSSFLYPTTVFHHKPGEWEEPELFRQPELSGFDPEDYVTQQVIYESKDGTEVPMFITHRRDVEPDGNVPTLLYGYGGFNIPILPSFSVENLAWMEQGGIYASANIRGGGEYGREWHQAGVQDKKQNVFDDFIAAAEYLIDEGYTSADNLGIYGRSNGGLLVGAVINQRPELFGAALPAVGVMDMLRFHKFTVGAGWAPDYGNPEVKEDFEVQLQYSPYHNIAEGHDYPPVLVTTADHDDRVVPGHSFKYAAMLQYKQAEDSASPMLIRIEDRAGHGAGMSTTMRIEEARDRWAFLAEHLGLELD